MLEEPKESAGKEVKEIGDRCLNKMRVSRKSNSREADSSETETHSSRKGKLTEGKLTEGLGAV